MIKIYLNNLSGAKIPEKKIQHLAAVAAREEKKMAGEVEINFIKDSDIKKINKTWRGRNKVTDVLSFAWQETPGLKSEQLGQIYIAVGQIRRQAKAYGVSFTEELSRLLAHGLLHLVGYDHIRPADERKMLAKQEIIVKKSLGL